MGGRCPEDSRCPKGVERPLDGQGSQVPPGARRARGPKGPSLAFCLKPPLIPWSPQSPRPGGRVDPFCGPAPRAQVILNSRERTPRVAQPSSLGCEPLRCAGDRSARPTSPSISPWAARLLTPQAPLPPRTSLRSCTRREELTGRLELGAGRRGLSCRSSPRIHPTC